MTHSVPQCDPKANYLAHKEAIDAAVRAAQIMGLHVCGVDMLEGAKGPQIMEVNSSPGLEGIEGATGLDIATMLAARPAAERAEITPIPWPERDRAAPDAQDPSSGLVFRASRG